MHRDPALGLVMPRWLKGRPTELACNQQCHAFQEEKQQAVQTLIDFFIIFEWFFHKLLLQAESNSGSANFYLALVYLKPLPRVWPSSSTAEKKAVCCNGTQSLIVYSIAVSPM